MSLAVTVATVVCKGAFSANVIELIFEIMGGVVSVSVTFTVIVLICCDVSTPSRSVLLFSPSVALTVKEYSPASSSVFIVTAPVSGFTEKVLPPSVIEYAMPSDMSSLSVDVAV